MKIEYKNKNYEKKDIFQVGNVFEHDGAIYLVSRNVTPGECTKYFLVNLKYAALGSKMYESLDELAQARISVWSDSKAEIKLVKAKLIIDYKLGDAEDEDDE
ncbi:hypothetical protein I6E16_03975 [Ligilactobacillus salivarius]|uniref:hypothetical protein n=1 Tax=Ligilactobacillus salivarius TaxID=1624 RepID=UPI001F215B9D|nr:hypothetical protein [Ligilactobacillus salivarius]MCF2623310.1 hypothetical protein [Ligilactobacillus salivarius]